MFDPLDGITVTSRLRQWAGPDSNRGLTDYESAADPPKPTGKTSKRGKRATPGATLHGPAAVANPELSTVVDNWTTLPEAVKAGIVAMVRASIAR